MGKLMDRLQQQLTTEHKQDAEDCLIIYNYLEDTTGGVWSSNWNPLVQVTFKGFPGDVPFYKDVLVEWMKQYAQEFNWFI